MAHTTVAKKPISHDCHLEIIRLMNRYVKQKVVSLTVGLPPCQQTRPVNKRKRRIRATRALQTASSVATRSFSAQTRETRTPRRTCGMCGTTGGPRSDAVNKVAG